MQRAAPPDVSDSGFDFKAPKRREAKRFEPPPWERDAFEELQRGTASENQPAPEETPSQEGDDEQGGPKPTREMGPESKTPVDLKRTVLGKPIATKEVGALDEKQVLEMMAHLAEQEPDLYEKAWKPAIASSLIVLAIGAVMTVWGVAAMVKTRSAGLTGVASSLVLLVFGLGFVAVAAWLIVRTLRQRGVL